MVISGRREGRHIGWITQCEAIAGRQAPMRPGERGQDRMIKDMHCVFPLVQRLLGQPLFDSVQLLENAPLGPSPGRGFGRRYVEACRLR